jgi:lipoprotein-anchoring transpeptidase ErfK/SrfK
VCNIAASISALELIEAKFFVDECPMSQLNRRLLITGASAAAGLSLAGCVGSQNPMTAAVPAPASPQGAADLGGPSDLDYRAIYASSADGGFTVPATNISDINPAFLRKNVAYLTRETPGTIVVDPPNHYLYHVEEGGKATRYGVGVGREGFAWSGEARIKSKQEWPDWYPPKEMMDRRPDLKKAMTDLQSGVGMHGGPENPLGARAMYLWQGNADTLFRIHGTNEPWTIGTSGSSGCIRMVNQDAMDLYKRTPVGTRVVVLGNAKVAHS